MGQPTGESGPAGGVVILVRKAQVAGETLDALEGCRRDGADGLGDLAAAQEMDGARAWTGAEAAIRLEIIGGGVHKVWRREPGQGMGEVFAQHMGGEGVAVGGGASRGRDGADAGQRGGQVVVDDGIAGDLELEVAEDVGSAVELEEGDEEPIVRVKGERFRESEDSGMAFAFPRVDSPGGAVHGIEGVLDGPTCLVMARAGVGHADGVGGAIAGEAVQGELGEVEVAVRGKSGAVGREGRVGEGDEADAGDAGDGAGCADLDAIGGRGG